MPTMIRGYNADGESKVFESKLPIGWETAKPSPEPKKKRRARSTTKEE